MANFWDEYVKYGQAAQKAAYSGKAPAYNVPSTTAAYSQAYAAPTNYWKAPTATTQRTASNPVPGGWTSENSPAYNALFGITTPSATTGGYGGNNPNIVSFGGKDYLQDYLGDWQYVGESVTSGAASGAMTEYQRAMIDLQLKQIAETTGASEEELALRRQQMEADIANQNAQLAWSKEQWGQQLAQEQKDYLANLAAEPHSWLEYAAASGQAPVIQPWMLPLMPQDYGVSAGQTIPGWSPTNMTGMPQLTNPSAQYSARIGPTAQQQYYGYEQARTGANPEESAWRLWSMAPPSGGQGLTQYR